MIMMISFQLVRMKISVQLRSTKSRQLTAFIQRPKMVGKSPRLPLQILLHKKNLAKALVRDKKFKAKAKAAIRTKSTYRACTCHAKMAEIKS